MEEGEREGRQWISVRSWKIKYAQIPTLSLGEVLK